MHMVPNPTEEVLTVFPLFQELLEKLKEAEDSHSTLQAECEQYRTVLAETVSDFNKHLCSTCVNSANME